MQASLPPAWAAAERLRRRRGRVALAELGELAARAHQLHLQMTLQELRRLRELHARPDLLLYSPSQLRQLVRLGMVGETGHGASSAPGWRPGPLGAPWRLPDTDPSSETLSGGAGGAGGAGAGAAGAGWSSYCGWGAGALLLLAALLLVRATDRCFMRNFNAARRRRSEEWPTPNVRATSQEAHFAGSNESGAGAGAGESGYVVCLEDLPPPYAEVTDAKREEPPPAYSDCCVVFRDPAVHYLPRQTPFDYDEPSTISPLEVAHSSNHCHVPSAQADNPIGSRLQTIPYADSTDTDSENGEEIGESGESGESGEGGRSTPATVRAEDDVSYISITDDVDTQSNRYL